MRNVVTVTQDFPSWAAACAARDRLARDRGFDEYGIERIDIERLGGHFELLIRTDEFHRDQIEHLLRSSGTRFNPPGRTPARGRAVPLLLAGAAAIATVGLLTALWPRREGGIARESRVEPRAAAPTGTPMFTLEADGGPIAVTKGNRAEAQAIFDGAEFRQKLRSMESDGTPLWNGGGRLSIRPASASEIRAFVQYAETLGFDDEEEGEIILYLRPIDTPDAFDETQDG